MVNQPLIIAAVGGAAVAGAVTVNIVLLKQEVDDAVPAPATKAVSGTTQASATAKPAAPKAAATSAPAAPAKTETAALPPQPAAKSRPAAPAAAKPKIIRPSFDVVRVNPKGDTVMAGRAEPFSEVRILEDGKQIGEIRADARGEWVFIPSMPLAPGNRQLSLASVGADGVSRVSDSAVMLLVPKAGQDLAGQPADQQRQAMILKLPADPAKARAETTLATKAKVRAKTEGTAAKAKPPTAASKSKSKPKPKMAAAAPKVTAPTRVLQRPTPATATTTPATKPSTRFTVDVVDYDDHGNLSIGGVAPATARINLYLNDGFLGRTQADGDGYWALTPDRRVAPGLYTLRADRIDTAGNVAARIAFPFSRAENLASMADGTFVIVQPGNSLWRIARRAYGSGFRYSVIYAANQGEILDPDMIFPGQVFKLPATN